MPASFRVKALGLGLALIAAPPATASPRPSVDAFLRAHFKTSATPRHVTARADLSGAGAGDMVVYVTAPEFCGTGGCNLLVLEPHRASWRIVMDATVVWPPIRLLPSRSRGWRNIAVRVSGGGATPHDAVMRFDGHRYPSNPSKEPSVRQSSRGSVLIGPVIFDR